MNKTGVAALLATGCMAPVHAGEVLWINDDATRSAGHSNATRGAFGFRRTLLDDFVVPEGETWRLSEFRHFHVWSTLPPGSGQGMQIAIWTDELGEPGTFDFDLNVTTYFEYGTGGVYFSRQEAESWTTFAPTDLGPGHYWFEAAIMGPEVDFWLTNYPVRESEHWVNYEDLGGLSSGTNQFGTDYDLGWSLGGQVIRDLRIGYPNGRPAALHACGDTVTVEISAAPGQTLDPDSPTLHVDAGSGFVAVPMNRVSLVVYDAVFPQVPCGVPVSYYVSARTASGWTVTDPPDAPGTTYVARSANEVVVVFEDDMEIDRGWTVENTDIERGVWERGVPAGGGVRGDPARDFDGSGRCWLTGNSGGDSDVDGGPTRLISPAFDLEGVVEPRIAYARWFNGNPWDQDLLGVEISNDDGAIWTPVESVATRNGWQVHAFRVEDVITPLTDHMRIRFTTADDPDNSITEAALDAVSVFSIDCTGSCPPPCPDADGNGTVNFADLLVVLAQWGPCPPLCVGDFDGDGAVGFQDLLIVLAAWGPCP